MANAVECNQIKELAQSGQYQDVLTVFNQLYMPDPQSERYAGHAYWALGDFTNASVLLRRALNHGEQGAGVDLIQLKVVREEIKEAEIEFNQFYTEGLSTRDTIQFQFLGGEIAYRQNKLGLAKKRLQDAWIEARAYPNAGSLVQAISLTLSTVQHTLGFGHEALASLDTALLSANSVWESFLRANRAEILFYLGRYDESRTELHKLTDSSRNNPQIAILFHTVSALNKFFEDHNDSIQTLFNTLIDAEDNIYSFSARFHLIGMLVHTKEFNQARGQLCKLEIHAHTQSEIAMLEMRRGQYFYSIGAFEKALQSLSIARTNFHDLEWRRELGWTLLHMAQLHVKMGEAEKASEYLDLVADVANIIENSAFLELERRLLGDLEPLKKVASSYGLFALEHSSVLTAPIMNRPAPRTLRLNTLGETLLYVNGKATPVKLNKGFVIMAYLLMYPHSTAENIVTNVFEGSKDVDAAKSYFHTARYQVQNACPYVRFEFDRITKTYSLNTFGVPIEFDYQEVAQLMHAPSENDFYQALELCRGSFLRGFEGEWIEEIRANMEWLLIRSGLKLVQEMYEAGDYQACRRLTERLLKVEPLDESLNELLVRATREVEGALASRKAMSKVESAFLQEVGELPPTLAQLKQEMKFRVN